MYVVCVRDNRFLSVEICFNILVVFNSYKFNYNEMIICEIYYMLYFGLSFCLLF